MNVTDQIEAHLASHPEPKQAELRDLHRRILEVAPDGRLWFFDGRDEDGKTVSNPTIGYGEMVIRYANGATREFFRVGLSANKSGISVHLMGIEDKAYLTQTYAARLGKASVSGYCIKFRTLKDIDGDVLMEAIRERLEDGSA